MQFHWQAVAAERKSITLEKDSVFHGRDDFAEPAASCGPGKVVLF